MSLFKGAKEFFGLGPLDDERDDAYYADDGAAAYAPRYDREPAPEPAPAPAAPAPRAPRESYRPAPVAQPEPYVPGIVATVPRSYAEATQIGEPFRDGDAVTFELTDTDNAVAKRIIDFAAGLCFASRGDMHNLTRELDTSRRVFALVPDNTDITVDELRIAAGLAR